MRYLDAVLILALVADIHGTDAAVSRAAQACSKKVERRYRRHLFEVINSPSPYWYVVTFMATLPDHIIAMVAKAPTEA